MWTRTLIVAAVFNIALFLCTVTASADVLKLKDGVKVEGVIKRVEAGIVYIRVGNEDKMFDILKVENIDFNTPHLLAETSNAPIEHFLNDIDSQEMVRNVQEIEKAAADIRKKLGQIRTYWEAKQPIKEEELAVWETAKRDFSEPLRRYQEVLNDLYFHVLAKVDEYNLIMKDAGKVYVGVKGVKIGSPLVLKEYERLPLRKYVPGAWYDTIYFDGYNAGYEDGYTKMIAPKTPPNR